MSESPCSYPKTFRPLPKNIRQRPVYFADDKGHRLEAVTELTADAFLLNDPVAVNVMPYGLHNAMMMIDMLNHSCFRLRADANEGSQSNGGSKNQVFHFEPLEHLGEYAARWRRTFMLRFTLTIHEHVLTFPRAAGPGGEVRQNATRGARKSRFSSASTSLSHQPSAAWFLRIDHPISSLASWHRCAGTSQFAIEPHEQSSKLHAFLVREDFA